MTDSFSQNLEHSSTKSRTNRTFSLSRPTTRVTLDYSSRLRDVRFERQRGALKSSSIGMAFVNPTRLGANPTPAEKTTSGLSSRKNTCFTASSCVPTTFIIPPHGPLSHRSVLLLLLSSLSLLLLHSSPLSSRTRRTTPPRSACRTRTRRLFVDPRVETRVQNRALLLFLPRPSSTPRCCTGKKFRRIFSRSRRTPSRRRPTWRRPRDLLLLRRRRRKRASRRRPRTSFLATGPSRFVVFVVVFDRSVHNQTRRILF